MASATDLCAVLRRATLLPIDEDEPQRVANHCDLLPELVRHWSGSRGREAARMRAWLERAAAQGARLSCGFAGARNPTATTWLGERLVWWHNSPPPRSWVAIASSRRAGPLERQPSWLTALCGAVDEVDRERECLLCVPGTAAAELVARAADRSGKPWISAAVASDSLALTTWVQRLRDGRLPGRDLAISPPIGGGVVADRLGPPARDRVLVGLADRIVVLACRQDGHLDRLLERRFTARQPGKVALYTGQRLVPESLSRRFQALGARPELRSATSDRPPRFDAAFERSHGPPAAAILTRPPAGQFLAHWTRRADGPWPGQTREAYLDALLDASPDADHSPLAALARIVRLQMLYASSRAIRGGAKVVSFTAAGWQALGQRRVFRRHRRRWDFEPYGLAVERGWLRQRGARPVQYGSESDYRALPEAERPFFQKATTGGSNGAPIDWRAEQEWRVPGDLLLKDAPAGTVYAFVPSPQDAGRLAPGSPWPIVVLGLD